MIRLQAMPDAAIRCRISRMLRGYRDRAILGPNVS